MGGKYRQNLIIRKNIMFIDVMARVKLEEEISVIKDRMMEFVWKGKEDNEQNALKEALLEFFNYKNEEYVDYLATGLTPLEADVCENVFDTDFRQPYIKSHLIKLYCFMHRTIIQGYAPVVPRCDQIIRKNKSEVNFNK